MKIKIVKFYFGFLFVKNTKGIVDRKGRPLKKTLNRQRMLKTSSIGLVFLTKLLKFFPYFDLEWCKI